MFALGLTPIPVLQMEKIKLLSVLTLQVMAITKLISALTLDMFGTLTRLTLLGIKSLTKELRRISKMIRLGWTSSMKLDL